MPEERARNVTIINKEGKTYTRHAEKICQKIKSFRYHSPLRLSFGSDKFRCTTHCFDTIKGGLRIAGI
jgi:hypothetical protein